MMSQQTFLNKIKPHAISASNNSGMLASVLAAQACLETGYGTSELSKRANNLFGIKGSYNGQSHTVRTAEHKPNGQVYYVNAAFRKYPSFTESFKDRIAFFTSTPWRTKTYKPVTDAKSKGYKAQVKALHESPYATDVLYDKKLLNIIETYRLYEWDKNTGGNSVGYTIVNQMNPSMYKYNAPYSMQPLEICIHNTANTASARNEVAYMNRTANYTSYHVAIDDKEAVQAIPFNRNAFAAGDGANGRGNRRAIHIEICYSLDGGNNGHQSARYLKAEENAALYTAYVLHQYGWGIDKVKKHQDYSGKYCPHVILANGKWNWFKNRVQAHLNAIKKGSSSASKKTTSKPKVSKKPQGVSEKGWSFAGTFEASETIVVRRGYKSTGAPRLHLNKPVAKGSYLKPGDFINFDHVWFADGYWWVRFKYPGRKDSNYYFVPLGVRNPAVEFSKAKLWGKLTKLSMKKGSKVLDWHKKNAIK